MTTIINELLTKLESTNPVQGKKIRAYLNTCDALFFERAGLFLGKYARLLQSIGKSWDYVVQCYNKLNADMTHYRIEFLRSGEYANKSFADVKEKIYENPEVMEYHMHGLVLAQLFWTDQYQRFAFFSDNLAAYSSSTYLEIGPGHGLYLSEAIDKLGDTCIFEAIDISPTSLEMTAKVIDNKAVHFTCGDIMKKKCKSKYDFITAGEVIEHLEDPASFLNIVWNLLADEGVFYLTTPANAPMIDHIFLFKDEREIINLIEDCRFNIVQKRAVFAENMDEARAIKYKVPLMFAAFLKKNL